MWGLGPPNKRIRVTNAMLANSRRLLRWELRRKAQMNLVISVNKMLNLPSLLRKSECVQSTQ